MIPAPNFSLLLVVACFWLVYFVVSRLLVKPMGLVLDERRRRAAEAQEGFDAAERSLREAVGRCERELAAAGLEAGKQRQALRSQGEAERGARLTAARELGQQRLSEIATDIEAATVSARTALRGQAGALARELASRLAGRSVA